MARLLRSPERNGRASARCGGAVGTARAPLLRPLRRKSRRRERDGGRTKSGHPFSSFFFDFCCRLILCVFRVCVCVCRFVCVCVYRFSHHAHSVRLHSRGALACAPSGADDRPPTFTLSDTRFLWRSRGPPVFFILHTLVRHTAHLNPLCTLARECPLSLPLSLSQPL